LHAQKKEKIEGEIFSYVDTVPEFVGGRDALLQFLTTNMEFPPKATKSGVKKGKVYVEFIVKADGTIANITINKTTDDLFNKEAIRLITIMPAWKSGVLNGKHVNTRYILPIKFGYDCVLDTK
jgi:protein TonB